MQRPSVLLIDVRLSVDTLSVPSLLYTLVSVCESFSAKRLTSTAGHCDTILLEAQIGTTLARNFE